MKKYSLIFSISYFLLVLVVGAVAERLELNKGTVLGIVPVIAASFLAAWRFTKDHNRQPTPKEKKTYSWQALLGAWIVSFLVTATAVMSIVFLSPDGMESLATVMALLIGTTSPSTADLAVVILIYIGLAVLMSLAFYLAIRWSFAWYAKMACRNQ